MPKNYPKVLITDETMRDGLQVEREGVTLDEKLELVNGLVAAGLKRLMVAAFVNPKWSPQMADSVALVERLRPVPGVEFFALALNERGQEAIRANRDTLSQEPWPMAALHLCEVFMQRNTNQSAEDQERRWRLPVERALASPSPLAAATIGLSAPWGSNWTGPITFETRFAALERLHEAWTSAGVPVVRVAFFDPMAWNQPHLVAEDLREIKRRWPTIKEFHLHLHNARGMAMLSAYEALSVLDRNDTLIVDTATGGIGGCPYCGNGQATGMIATEDFVQLLQVLGVPCDIDLDQLIEVSHRLSSIIGRRLHSQVSLNGPLPIGNRAYDPEVPAIYTFEEAQHFRVGPSVYRGNPTPWKRKPLADGLKETLNAH